MSIVTYIIRYYKILGTCLTPPEYQYLISDTIEYYSPNTLEFLQSLLTTSTQYLIL